MTRYLVTTFVNSRLTPLVMLVALLLGAGATLVLPREEEPQITVPMADVLVAYPGATAAETEKRVTYPVEKLVKELPGVEYVYSTTRPGESLVIVRFFVGTDPEDALVRLYTKLYSNFDRIPPGVSQPLIKSRSIDDVPVLALTLSSPALTGYQLRQVAAQLDEEIKQVEDVSEVTIIGGSQRRLRVDLEPERLAAYNLTTSRIAQALQHQNVAAQAGMLNNEILIRAGGFYTTVEEVGDTIVATHRNRPVYLKDVATLSDGPEDPTCYVFNGEDEAVTLAVAKRRGSNAIKVTRAVLERVRVPDEVTLTVTRDYGETAAERSNELLYHMGIAVMSVTLLMWWALGRRESVVVAAAIPVTLGLTLFTFVLYGFTLNRVTFFALIFSIGILVDDAIVVVENVVRHLRMPENRHKSKVEVVIEAVVEVGNPTVLATFTVVAAILPMAFVRGLMGPYMLPIPLGASAAILFSMLVAFTVVPWVAVRVIKPGGHEEEEEDALTRLYRRFMAPILHRPALFLVTIMALLLASMALIPLKLVVFKMLPFDNKSEFQVLLDMPEGTSLEDTASVALEMGREVAILPEVTNYQVYVGTSAPYNFNGLVRHYFMRTGPNLADLQVNLEPKHHRDRQSHDVAVAIRPRLAEIARKHRAVVQVTEIPPGPPVLQTLVTEVYGPGRHELAGRIKALYEASPGVVDVDWYVEDAQPQITFEIDRTRAVLSNVSPAEAVHALETALKGQNAGLLHDPEAREEVPIVLRFTREARTRLRDIQLNGTPLDTLVTPVATEAEKSIYHKNLQPVVYVTGDVSGGIDSPLYSILDIGPNIDVKTYFFSQPPDTDTPAVKWDGEWQVTYEVFRDLGIAFAVVMLLIYALIVGWFQNFLTPLVILSAIPFSLVGILPAHMLLGAFFTATSMIGFIAGAGIVVRNSIILVDFIELRLAEGVPLEQAVIDAGAVRFRPMLLTAAAVVVGSAVILADPIFNGLAISLMAGEVASLLLSRTAVPVLYYLLWKNRRDLPGQPAKSHQ